MLPLFAYQEIFKYLDFRDLANASLVCKEWQEVLSGNDIWKPICSYYWLLETLPNTCETWKDAFILYMKKYGEYINEYRHIKGAWNRIEKWYADNCPEVLDQLQSGIDESVLKEFEKSNSVRLPKDLKLSLMIHNGQNEKADIGILGNLFEQSSFNANNLVSNFLCAFKTSKEHYDPNRKMLLLNISPDPAVLVSPAKFFMFYQKLSDHDDKQSDKNRIFAFSRYLTGENYVVADSFTEWLSEFADKLSQGAFSMLNGQLLLYDKSTEVTAVTENITVTVRWAFVPGWNQNQARFEYFIQMQMGEAASEFNSCKLESRSWVIYDDDTKYYENVSGKGVVGEYPTMIPGAKFFWQSSTWFKNSGWMQGHFVMRRLYNPALTVNIKCPQFYMKSPWKKLS